MPEANLDLAAHTTLRLGGPARTLRTAHTSADVIEAVSAADAAGDPVLVLAGGSNVVVSDAGFDGTVVLLRSTGIRADNDGDHVVVTVEAGHPWDDLVAEAVSQNWSGVECLSGIPGSTGATPIQNVGAYGQDVSETFDHALAWDRAKGVTRRFNAPDCRFTYRDSVFKHNDRFIVLSVTYRLRRDKNSSPIRYAETARSLGVETGETVPLTDAREAVLRLRRGKGMVLDPDDADTRSVGSFFVNPVMSREAFDALAAKCDSTPPHYPDGENVKVPAAWLIGAAGFERGFGSNGVAISTKHTLALTNRGEGTTTALLALAAEVSSGVHARFGVALRPEPVLVGVTWNSDPRH